MSRRKHPILEMENWVEAKYKEGALPKRLAEGNYPPLEKTGPIPEKFFQHFFFQIWLSLACCKRRP